MTEAKDDSSPPLIVWFRRDLRLADNPALASAAAGGQPVIPLFVFEETTDGRPLGAAARWWLDGSLRALDASLRAKGSRLILRHGDAGEALQSVIRETGATCVLLNRRYTPADVQRDAALESALDAAGVEIASFNASLLNEPWEVMTGADLPYRVFTPYWRTARARLDDRTLRRAPSHIRPPPNWPASDALDGWALKPKKPDWSVGFDWSPGEDAAQARLDHFLDHGARDYGAGRDRPAADGSSRLSPHLHWGEIGPRQIVRRLELAQAHGLSSAQAEAFLRELGWREFNHQLLFHHPDLATANLRPAFDRMAWRRDPEGFRAWARGETGYPMVDAGMRQLWATGWMHNRVRMIVASFLIKDLLIDWREGEAWFWDTLVDADAANNAANWQWVAGSGADAQPFFRIFNPVAQGERFDPAGAYVRRWVPELAKLPDDLIHQPWTGDDPTLKAAGVTLGETYPRPLVDHRAARERALAAYRETR